MRRERQRGADDDVPPTGCEAADVSIRCEVENRHPAAAVGKDGVACGVEPEPVAADHCAVGRPGHRNGKPIVPDAGGTADQVAGGNCLSANQGVVAVDDVHPVQLVAKGCGAVGGQPYSVALYDSPVGAIVADDNPELVP